MHIMAVETGCWLKLNPSTIECVPEAPGIFEIANLVLWQSVGNGNCYCPPTGDAPNQGIDLHERRLTHPVLRP